MPAGAAARAAGLAPVRWSPPLRRREAAIVRPSPAVQDYLKAIFMLGEERGHDGPITTSRVAEALAVTAPSASNMLSKLDDLGFVSAIRLRDGDRRQGVRLTPAGRLAAVEVVRHHRLLETYLVDQLGVPLDEVHREAEVLEHHISQSLAERIAVALGHPERDPHGDPIPSAAGDIAAVGGRALADLPVGTRGVVLRVDDHDDELLRYLADRGLLPDAEVEVLELGQFGGPISLSVAGGRVEVSPLAARSVRVTETVDQSTKG